MVNKTFSIPLDLKVPSASYDVEVVEGDNGNIFVITLTDDGESVDLSGCKVLAVFSRPDGATVQQDTDGHGITVGGDHNNIVTIDLYTSSVRPGTVACELQVYSGEGQDTLVTSAQFTFQCCRSIMNEETILSEEKYPILVGLISQVAALAARLGDMVKSVYDSDDDGIVDAAATAANADKLGGELPAHYATAAALAALTPADVGAAPAIHAARHASDGADPLTPTDIGAAAVRRFTVEVPAAWNGDGPYTQQITVTGMTADMIPKCDILFDDLDPLENRLAQKEAWLCVDEVESGAGIVVLTCFDTAPESAFTLQMEVVL